MFLEFGIDKNNNSVHISDYNKNDIVRCEFCNNELIGKKGRVKTHHFAHKKGESSKQIAKLLNEKMSIRKIAKQVDCSINTVQKVKKLANN